MATDRAGINQVFLCKACSAAFMDRAGAEPVDLPWDEIQPDGSLKTIAVRADPIYVAQCATDGHAIALADSRRLRFERGGIVHMLDPVTQSHTRDTFKTTPQGEPRLTGARFLE